MKSEIRRLGIVQAGKVCAILYGFFGLIFLPIAAIALIADPAASIPFVLIVLFYPLMGFIGGLLCAALYNLSARIGGGLLLDLVQAPQEYEPARPDDIPLNPSPSTPGQERQDPGDGRMYAPPGYYD